LGNKEEKKCQYRKKSHVLIPVL